MLKPEPDWKKRSHKIALSLLSFMKWKILWLGTSLLTPLLGETVLLKNITFSLHDEKMQMREESQSHKTSDNDGLCGENRYPGRQIVPDKGETPQQGCSGNEEQWEKILRNTGWCEQGAVRDR